MIYSVTQQTSFTYSESRLSTAIKTHVAEVPESRAGQSTDVTTVQIDRRSSTSSSTFSSHKPTGVEVYKSVDESREQNNPYATTILRFIDLQLQRDKADGATEEELQSRLQAGLEGFMQGYHDAYDQLSASGVLSEDVKTAVEDTYRRVLDGVAAMADTYGVANPVNESDRLPSEQPASATPSATPLAEVPESVASPIPDRMQAKNLNDLHIIQELQSHVERLDTSKSHQSGAAEGARAYDYRVSEARTFDFQLRTAQGDQVTVRINASHAGAAQYGRGDNHSGLTLAGQSSSFMFSVEGDLNEKELKAINELLSAVGDISAAFFAGEFDQAFERASNFRLQGSQIDSFALKLQMTKTEQSTLGHGLYTPQIVGNGVERGQMEQMAKLFEKAGVMADKLQQPRTLVEDLLTYVAQQTRPDDPRVTLLGAAAKQFL